MPHEVDIRQTLDFIFEKLYNRRDGETAVLKIGFWDDMEYTFWATLEDKDGNLIAESELGLDTIQEALDQLYQEDWAEDKLV